MREKPVWDTEAEAFCKPQRLGGNDTFESIHSTRLSADSGGQSFVWIYFSMKFGLWVQTDYYC